MASRWPEVKKAFEVVKDINEPKMSAEEAIKSTEPNVVKGAHSSVKGKISSAVASFGASDKNAARDFDHGKISRTTVLAAQDKLVTNLKLFK